MTVYAKNWISRLLSNGHSACNWNYDDDGINLIFTDRQLIDIQSSRANELLMHQYIALKMLVEHGEAEELPNGYMIPTSNAVHLDETSRTAFGLPDVWHGRMQADIRSTTGKSDFTVNIKVSRNSGGLTSAYRIEGPTISFGDDELYLMSPAQHEVFLALANHACSEKQEYDDLSLVLTLQQAQKSGLDLALGHFETLKINAPESITIVAERDDQGQLILTPMVGQAASHDRMQKVLGQLAHDAATSLRVDDEIILFNEEKMHAVHEILRNRKIPQDKVNEFIKNPTAFINASFVDLDIGFSFRVQGATRFRHAYFGETDDAGIDWFGRSAGADVIYPPGKLGDVIKDPEQLKDFREKLDDAYKAGASEIELDGMIFDITDKTQTEKVLANIEHKFHEIKPEPGDNSESDGESGSTSDEAEEDYGQMVVDIMLNDDVLQTPSAYLGSVLDDVLTPESDLDWSGYKRNPYPHQIEGTRWILGLMHLPDGEGGALLADDMGLGKTFMSLAAMQHVYSKCKSESDTQKPCLVVAPLSLLVNWKDEVEQTFIESPFRDIVILQSDGDLPRYRLGGAEIHNQDLTGKETAEIRYSLKIGQKFTTDRLDMPGRLVITTYQTLRDYQFSICAIDWGMVVFDEAQNIKNPNAIQTRAAKGLKADFRLLATGTPVENSLADFWCLMDTACPGYLSSYQDFRAEYVTPVLRAAGDEIDRVRAAVGRTLREKVGALMLRRVKEDNLEGLPEKTVFVGIEDECWKYLPALGTMLAGGQLEAYDNILGSTGSSSNAVLAALQRLRDVSLHPRLVLGGALNTPADASELQALLMESGKFDSLLKVLDEIRQREEKCILFVVNKRLQAFLAQALAKKYKLPPLSVINGDTKAVSKRASALTRKSMIRDFEAREGFNIIVMSPVAAGVGFTIVGANNVIHLERHWNPAKEAQATDRVYRIGQQRNVNVYIPLIHHPHFQSFDINLHQLLSTKTLLKDAVVTQGQVMPTPGGFTEHNWSPTAPITFSELQHMSWDQFEALCAELMFKAHGAKNCRLTKHGSDYGADVVLDLDTGCILVQCKYTSGASYDGYSAVMEVVGAKAKYAATLAKPMEKLLFVTNATKLAAKARQTARDCSVDVIDGKALADLLKRHPITWNDVLSRLEKPRLSV